VIFVSFEEKMISMMEVLISKFDSFEEKQNSFEAKQNSFEARLEKLETEMKEGFAKVEQELADTRKHIGILQEENAEYAGDFTTIGFVIDEIKKRVEENGLMLANLEIKHKRESRAVFDLMMLALDKTKEAMDNLAETEVRDYGVRIRTLEIEVAQLLKTG